MNTIENMMNNNAVTAMSRKAAPAVVSAIRTASLKTGVNFAYLMEKAAAESGFNAKAKSGSSSASGLFQFIESTWLRMVKAYGHKFGMGDLAQHIDNRGRVSDPAMRKEILALRNDPEKAAMMAAQLDAENRQYLQRRTDGPIGATELYLAHFLGAGGAAGFLNAMKKNPLAAASDIFPQAANANRNVFYDPKTGEPRTLAGVYDFFARKFSISNGDKAQAVVQAEEKESQTAGQELALDVLQQQDASSWIHENRKSALNILSTPDSRYRGTRPSFAPSLPTPPVVNPVQVMVMASLHDKLAR